jgi:hypothetical protein
MVWFGGSLVRRDHEKVGSGNGLQSFDQSQRRPEAFWLFSILANMPH